MSVHPSFPSIVGTWRLLSHRTVFDNGDAISLFGTTPRGRLIVTAGGYMMAFVVDPRRQQGNTDEQCAALHRSMVAYGGAYRVEGNKFLVAVDLSWHQMWDGTEQARTFMIENDTLHIRTAPAASVLRPGRVSHTDLVWERDRQGSPHR